MYRLLELNPQLQDFSWDIDYRMQLYRDTKNRLVPDGSTLNDFANAHNYFGIHHVDGGWVYREWAPNAHQLYLTGDFNGWNWTEHPMIRYGDGCWVLFLEGDDALWEGCKVKTIVDANMERTARIPLYAHRVIQEPYSITWCAEVVDDRKTYAWTDADFKGENSLYIYEAHVGMAQEHGHVGTYREFADYTLPRIKEAGYNKVVPGSSLPVPYNLFLLMWAIPGMDPELSTKGFICISQAFESGLFGYIRLLYFIPRMPPAWCRGHLRKAAIANHR